MLVIKSCRLPDNALLNEYVRIGAYTDCFRTDIDGNVTHAMYVGAFYTTLLFKLERLILKWLVSKPSSDNQALQLADGDTDSFAAWQVEKRCENQLLLSDFSGRTRSWFMVAPVENEANNITRLYFGSAVTTVKNSGKATGSSGFGFSLLISFHKIYSVLLLYSAKIRLEHKIT